METVGKFTVVGTIIGRELVTVVGIGDNTEAEETILLPATQNFCLYFYTTSNNFVIINCKIIKRDLYEDPLLV